jgi:hypothetical protein
VLNRIWSTLDEDHPKSYRKQTLNSQIKSYSQRPATPFETKELRKASPASLKEINDDIGISFTLNISILNLIFDKYLILIFAF